nr:uncharacterized protein LOC106845726 [Equus asinus]
MATACHLAARRGIARGCQARFSRSWSLLLEIWVPQLRPLRRVVPGRVAGAAQGLTIPVGDEGASGPRGSLSFHSRALGGWQLISRERGGPTFGRQVTLGRLLASPLGAPPSRLGQWCGCVGCVECAGALTSSSWAPTAASTPRRVLAPPWGPPEIRLQPARALRGLGPPNRLPPRGSRSEPASRELPGDAEGVGARLLLEGARREEAFPCRELCPFLNFTACCHSVQDLKEAGRGGALPCKWVLRQAALRAELPQRAWQGVGFC